MSGHPWQPNKEKQKARPHISPRPRDFTIHGMGSAPPSSTEGGGRPLLHFKSSRITPSARSAHEAGLGWGALGQASWFVDGTKNVVRLRDDFGQDHDVSALDIWRAEFELLDELDGLGVSPPSAAGLGIEFAPEAGQLRPFIVAIETGELVLALQLTSRKTSPITVFPSESQIIADGTWYCLDDAITEELREYVSEFGVPLGKPLSAAQTMNLVWKWSIPCDIDLDEKTSFSSDYRGSASGLIQGDLYPYQALGIERLLDLYAAGVGCLLADEMGLGKTVQIIALLQHASGTGQCLVVCPASTLANWKRELARFAPSLHTHIHQGPKRYASARQLQPYDVVLTSYETMASDVHSLKAFPWEVVAFDEAQYLKNPTADRSLSARLLKARAKVAVTGTPIENSLRDLWSLVDLSVPNYLPELEDFAQIYPDAATAARALGHRVAPVVIRRRLSDVADALPERVTTTVPIAMGDDQASVYNSVLTSNQSILAKLVALRGCAGSLDTAMSSAKHQFLHELTSEAFSIGKKVLVFSSFSSTIDQLAAGFLVHGRKLFVEKLDGRTPIEARQPLIDKFTQHDGPGVLVLNPRAAGVGLNIQSANYVVHFTPEWNPAVVDQASARAHRRGQLQTVFVYHLYYENTIEEVMIDRLDTKRQLQIAGLAPISETPSEGEISRILSFSATGVQNGQ